MDFKKLEAALVEVIHEKQYEQAMIINGRDPQLKREELTRIITTMFMASELLDRLREEQND